MATTLERASFAAQKGGWINVKFTNPTGIAVGNNLTITKPDGGTITGTVVRLLPLGSAVLAFTGSSKPSGDLLIPKGSAVA